MCKQRAEVVIFVTVFTLDGEQSEIELALCRTCYQWEKEMEEELTTIPFPFRGGNPVKEIKVESLPRAKRPLKGRKLG